MTLEGKKFIKTEDYGIVNVDHIMRIYSETEPAQFKEPHREIFSVHAVLDSEYSEDGEKTQYVRLLTLCSDFIGYDYTDFTTYSATQEWFDDFCRYVSENLTEIDDYSGVFDNYEKEHPLVRTKMSEGAIEAYMKRCGK